MRTRLPLLLAALVLVLALLPQIVFWMNGGSASMYFVSNYDEPAYSAYVNALASGKPRKYDPFLQEASPNESLFSIQFVPAYIIAMPLRASGISTSAAFIVLISVLAVLSYAALFWFLKSSAGSVPIAAVGAFAVLCFGTLVAYQGELRQMLTGRVLIDFFPFLRRYQPGLAFPLFFVFCGCVWKGLNDANIRRRYAFSAAAGAAFAGLVFSYFYLWTTAGAWFICFLGMVILLKKELRARGLGQMLIVGVCAVAALLPYFQMLAQRSPDVDAVQLLDRTRSPNVASSVLIAGLLVAAILIFKLRASKRMVEPMTLLCLSLALTPAIVLNQQVITGTALQPVHYEIFIANYLVLAAAVLAFVAVRGPLGKDAETGRIPRPLVYLTLAAALWGFLEATTSASRASAAAALRDASIPAIREVGTRPDAEGAVVLATNFVTADIVPTVTTLRPLWNAHLSAAGGISNAENKRLFYLFLHFSGYGSKELAEELRARSFEVTAAVFGSERALPSLASRAMPVSDAEIRAEITSYERFIGEMDATTAHSPALSYAIVPAAADIDLTAVDRWYQRDAGVRAGLFTVYKLMPR